MSEQGLLIETKSASLETMAVTIQALHVNGKQMTLAVFRQLPESWYREDIGVPWGFVRHVTAAKVEIWIIHSVDGRLERYKTTGPIDRGSLRKELKSEGLRGSSLADAFDEAIDDHKREYNADLAIVSTLSQLFIAV